MSGSDRPAGVPEEATWHGGLQGGDYILLTRDEAFSGLYRVRVWHESTGDLLADGVFAVRAPGDPIVDVRSEKLVSCYDGESLLLVDERVLTPVPWVPVRTYMDVEREREEAEAKRDQA